MDDEDFLAAVEADNATVPAEVEPEATPQVEPKQEERVEPVADQPIVAPVLTEPTVPTEPSLTVEAPKPPPGFVPIAAVHEARGELKALRDQLAAHQQPPAQPQPEPIEIPDPIDDPVGFSQYQQAAIAEGIRQTNLNWSKRIATIEHGPEVVDKAYEWAFQKCAQDPLFNAKLRQSQDPVGLAVAEFNREQIATQVTPKDFEDFLAWRNAQGALQQQAAPAAAPPNQAAPTPPRSLAGAPSAGGVSTQVPITDEDIFEGAFSKKA